MMHGYNAERHAEQREHLRACNESVDSLRRTLSHAIRCRDQVRDVVREYDQAKRRAERTQGRNQSDGERGV